MSVRRRESRGRRAAVTLMVSAATFMPFLAYVWSHLQILGIGYRIEATETRLIALEQENRRLRLAKAGLESLAAIEERARALGLTPLLPARLLVVRPPSSAPPRTPDLVVESR